MLRLSFLLLLFISSSLYATTSWELRVHQANFDVEAHELTNSEYKAYLDKTSWRCWADKPTKSSNLDIRALRCNYSVEQLGAFKSHASCGPGKIFDEVAIDLRDERKNLDLKVILICRYKSDSNS